MPDWPLIVQVLAPGGLAVAAIKVVLNGTAGRVKGIDTKLDRHIEKTDKDIKVILRALGRVEGAQHGE